VDPSLYEIRPVKALDNGIGKETVFALHSRHGALASINGGFFIMEGALEGKACGALKIENWYSLSFKPRGCMGWSKKDQRLQIDRLLNHAYILYNNTKIPIDGLNRARNDKEAIVFTPCFHKTTLTASDGEEILVCQDTIQQIVQKGSSKIPENGFVISIQKNSPLFGTFTAGSSLSFHIQSISFAKDSLQNWDECDYIIGGTPLLLHPGYKEINFAEEKTRTHFLTSKQVRTAVGLLSNGHWVFVAVDKLGLFDGMNLYTLADFLKKLGCIYAVNLDGGWSSTMIYQNDIKTPIYEKTLRPVSDAILIFPKK
jgi:hypothetical protein